MTSSISGGSASTTSGAEFPTVLVLGCGWLGMALARSLAAAGHAVIGTTTSSENIAGMEAAGIQSHLLQLGPDFNLASEALLLRLLKAANVLVLNVPPRAAAAGAYPNLLRPVHRAVAKAGTPHVLFVSSTSVYPNESRVLTASVSRITRDSLGYTLVELTNSTWGVPALATAR
jgi:nucleoside-diphosphate-sugar epimerase